MQICASFGIDSRQMFDALTLKIRRYIQETFPPTCPRCHSEDIVKDGMAKRKNIPDVQMFQCKRCGKKFCERAHTPFYRKHYSAGFIMTMAWLFYERGSMHWIAGAFAVNPTYKTLYKWITEIAGCLSRVQAPIDDGIAEADEMCMNACGHRYYLCGIWNKEHIFILPLQGNSSFELYIALQYAQAHLGEIQELHTDGWEGYKNATRWLGIQHRSVNRSQEGFVSEEGIHSNHMECLWSLVRRWLETARGYHKPERFNLMLQGYISYHNRVKHSQNVGKALVYTIMEGYKLSFFSLCFIGRWLPAQPPQYPVFCLSLVFYRRARK